MNKIKYDSNLIKLITLFESMTGAKVKDCISNEKLIFVIGENEMGKAIGKNGINIRKMEKMLKRRIKLVEFSNNVLQFVRNMAYPVEILDVNMENDIITIHGKDANKRGILIGRERQHINHLTDIVKRYFEVREIKVE